MKTSFTNTIFSFLAAIYFVVAGLGFNYVNYCCQACANEGIESVALITCNTLHHHSKAVNHDKPTDDVTCGDFNHDPQGCHLVRLKVDVPSFNSFSYNIPDNNTIFLADLFCNQPLLTLKYSSEKIVNIRPPNNLLPVSGRDLITFHSVLLI